jgi:hypothetical protein
MKKCVMLSGLSLMLVLIFSACDSGSDSKNEADEYFDRVTLDRSSRPGDPRKVAIEPEAVELTFDGESVIFNALGGAGGYRWELEFPARGDLQVRGSSQARYTRRGAGENMIIVYSGGYAAVARINQPPAAAP